MRATARSRVAVRVLDVGDGGFSWTPEGRAVAWDCCVVDPGPRGKLNTREDWDDAGLVGDSAPTPMVSRSATMLGSFGSGNEISDVVVRRSAMS